MAKKSKPIARLKKRAHGAKVAARLEACITCDAAAGDPTGKVTLYGIFDRVFMNEFPGSHTFFVYGRVTGTTGKHNVAVTLIGPGLTEKHNAFPPIDLDIPNAATQQFAILVSGAVFKRPGKHQIQVLFDGKPLGHPYTLSVERRKKPS